MIAVTEEQVLLLAIILEMSLLHIKNMDFRSIFNIKLQSIGNEILNKTVNERLQSFLVVVRSASSKHPYFPKKS